MGRGGARPNSGRNAINGKEFKIKIQNTIVSEIEYLFIGKNVYDKLRFCLEYGVKSMKKNKLKVINENSKFNVVDLF